MEYKICIICNENKLLKDYSLNGANRRNQCKSCRVLIESLKRQNNIEIFKEKDKKYYKNNKEAILERNKDYRLDNREQICQQKKEYYQNNKEEILEYHQNNKEKRNEYKRNRMKNDVIFRISETLKVRIHDVLKYKKEETNSNLIGCSKKILKNWLEYQFNDSISWDNYGDVWHIDHVVPINFFDISNVNEQLICFNWTNLRPLDKTKNISKSDKIIESEIIVHINILKTFQEYQTNFEKSWWRRVELRYGKNLKDEKDYFKNLLKWAISSQASKTDMIGEEEGSTTKC